MKETWATLSDIKVMRGAFFLECEGAAVDEFTAITKLYDDFVVLHGKTVQHLVAARIRRLLYCWLGWPHRHRRFHLGDQMAEVHGAFEQISISPFFPPVQAMPLHVPAGSGFVAPSVFV